MPGLIFCCHTLVVAAATLVLEAPLRVAFIATPAGKSVAEGLLQSLSPAIGPVGWFFVLAGVLLVANEYILKKPYSRIWPLFLSALLLVVVATSFLG
jgi:hypothetical protein